MSGDARIDLPKIVALGPAGVNPMRVRADANNAWQRPIEAGLFLKSLCYPFAAIEEPVHAGDREGQHLIATATGATIILDESLRNVEHLVDYAGVDFAWLANIRISKLGGLIRSLDIARRAASLGAGIIVGAQLGETSLLTRAALAVAHAMRDNLYAQEGAYGRLLLSHDVIAAPIQFGQGGMLAARDVPNQPGFGLSVTDIRARS